MSHFIVFIKGKCLFYFVVLWPLLFISVSYILFYYFNGNDEVIMFGLKQPPTMSQTGAFQPEDVLFTFGLHLESILLFFYFIMVYNSYKDGCSEILLQIRDPEISSEQKEEATLNEVYSDKTPTLLQLRDNINNMNEQMIFAKQLKLWNGYALYCGVISSILMALVGSISLKVNFIAHSVLAGSMFFLAVLHMAIVYFKLERSDGSYKLLKLRVYLLICIPLNLILLFVALVVFLTCSSNQCNRYIVNVFPSMEFISSIFLLLYLEVHREAISQYKISSHLALYFI